jgi:Nitrile hydratase, alpha chain
MQRFEYSKDRETVNAARARALEALLIEKGVITSDTVDKIMIIFATEMGPFNGAKLVAKAWVDPAFKKLLGEDTMAAVEKMNFVTKGAGAEGEHMRAAMNTPEAHKSHHLHSVLVLSLAGSRLATLLVQGSFVPRASCSRTSEGLERIRSKHRSCQGNQDVGQQAPRSAGSLSPAKARAIPNAIVAAPDA